MCCKDTVYHRDTYCENLARAPVKLDESHNKKDITHHQQILQLYFTLSKENETKNGRKTKNWNLFGKIGKLEPRSFLFIRITLVLWIMRVLLMKIKKLS